MLAIYKRELHSIFHSVIGYVFMAVIMFFTGLYFLAVNLGSGYPYFAYTLSSIVFITMLVIPILTMRIMTEDKKQNTDQLLYTAPVSIVKILVGKYLSLLTTFLVPLAIMCLYPLILMTFGSVPLLETYSAIFGFALFGAACLAIGMFMSAITDNQIVAAILTLVLLFIGYMMKGIIGLLFTSENLGSKILGCYDISSHITSFFSGSFSLKDTLYFVTLVLLFLFFTYQIVQKKRFSVVTKRITRSAFSAGLIIVVVAVSVLANYGVSLIPDTYTVFDVTKEKIYNISDQTKEVLASLDEDITFYVIAAESMQDETVARTLNQYKDGSSHIKIEYKDPSLFPDFASGYVDGELTSNSIIVESEKRSRAIDYNNLFTTEIDYTTYQENVTGYDAEGQLTSAIDYVTNDSLSKMYVIAGHNELELPMGLTSQIEKENIETETINLLDYESLPEDAACVFIAAPTTDYTKEDADKMLAYLEAGGHAIVVNSWNETDMPNFDSIWDTYGIHLADGIVIEGDADHFHQNPYYLLPDISGSAITSSLYNSNRYIFMPYAQGITTDENLRDTLTIQQILTTSDQAYLKTDPTNMTTYEKEDGDIDGPFAVGVYATETAGDGETKLLYLTTENLLQDDVNETVAGANYELIMNAVSNMVEHEVTISIPAKSYQIETLTVPRLDFLIWGLITLFILPVGLLSAGIIIWARRRKL